MAEKPTMMTVSMTMVPRKGLPLLRFLASTYLALTVSRPHDCLLSCMDSRMPGLHGALQPLLMNSRAVTGIFSRNISNMA